MTVKGINLIVVDEIPSSDFIIGGVPKNRLRKKIVFMAIMSKCKYFDR